MAIDMAIDTAITERAGSVGADNDVEDAVVSPAGGMKKRRRWLLSLLAVVMLGGAAGLYVWFSRDVPARQAAMATPPPVFVEMPEILVSLSTVADERTKYLKLKAVLEVSSEPLASQLKPLLPRVVDLFQTFARELRPADLNGSMGLLRLREELTRRANAAVAPAKINAVLFREVILQ